MNNFDEIIFIIFNGDGAEILYQSPNANSILQTLLQASRYSANEIDKIDTTKKHLKSQYKDLER